MHSNRILFRLSESWGWWLRSTITRVKAACNNYYTNPQCAILSDGRVRIKDSERNAEHLLLGPCFIL